MTENSTVDFDGDSSELLTEGVGESPYKRRREEPITNIVYKIFVLGKRVSSFENLSRTMTNVKLSVALPFLVRQVSDLLLKLLWMTIVLLT